MNVNMVQDRVLAIWSDYQRHACQLDRRFSPPLPASQTYSTRPGQVAGPILRHLRSFGRTRGLAFGAYGEASSDVHDLLSAAATQQAERVWREAGARSAAEMRALLIGRARRRMGMAAVQAFARHRLARVPYVGVSRAVVEMRAPRGGGVVGAGWVHEAQEIYQATAAYQARGGWRGA